nr:zinc ribbon domain-containing protein [Actinomadura meyerae]
MLLCGLCQRRMDSHWVNERNGYRCRHGYNSTTPRSRDAPKNLYLREDHLLDELMRQLSPRLGEARSPHELVAHLKRNGLAIVCDRSSCTVVDNNKEEPAPGTTTQIELFASPMG